MRNLKPDLHFCFSVRKAPRKIISRTDIYCRHFHLSWQLFDVHRAVHRNIISIVKSTRCTNVSNSFHFGMALFMFRTVFPSIISSSRLYIQQQTFVKDILLWQSWTADDRRKDRPKHEKCHSKMKWIWHIGASSWFYYRNWQIFSRTHTHVYVCVRILFYVAFWIQNYTKQQNNQRSDKLYEQSILSLPPGPKLSWHKVIGSLGNFPFPCRQNTKLNYDCLIRSSRTHRKTENSINAFCPSLPSHCCLLHQASKVCSNNPCLASHCLFIVARVECHSRLFNGWCEETMHLRQSLLGTHDTAAENRMFWTHCGGRATKEKNVGAFFD